MESKEKHNCPVCGNPLSGYDTKLRNGIQSDGSRRKYRIRRLRCTGCKKTHVELPDFLVPRKHYEVAVIEARLDKTSNDCPADDSTIRRWLVHFCQIKEQLEGMLRKLWSDKHSRHYPFLTSSSLLKTIRRQGCGWLTGVSQMIVNAGLWQPTQFAFSP
ncbi:DUF6431 domain-containing protein [Petrocella sp. FN5]|uniref:DUF6431 domain-containing protein n=1 Tax=Petrocella sp. FN5 TaxID=3032002 RepID=UPI003FA7953D